MGLGSAFNQIIKLKQKTMKIARLGTFVETDIPVAPSNYARNMAGPEDMSIKGREFVISIEDLNNISFPFPLTRGDILIDNIFGSMRITDAQEMYGLKGEVLGFRVRTS